MFDSLDRKNLLRLSILCALTICLWFFSSKATSTLGTHRDAGQLEGHLPAKLVQLQSSHGIVPVELNCQTVHPAKRPELLVFTCTIKNNTNKPISAFSIDYAIYYERWTGGEFPDSGLLTQDARIHPDFRESHGSQLVPPGGQKIVDRGEPIQHEDASAKRIEAKFDYVEFDDDTTLGPNVKGSIVIASIREGAAKYKGWLKQKFLESGKSMDTIAPLLQDPTNLPAELQIDDPMLVLGAETYQKKARELYRNRGAAEVEKRLNK